MFFIVCILNIDWVGAKDQVQTYKTIIDRKSL